MRFTAISRRAVRWIAAVASLTVSVSVGVTSAHGGSDKVEATFTKFVTHWPNMAGSVGGAQGPGTFARKVLDYNPGPVTVIAAIYNFTGSRLLLTALVHVVQTGLKAEIIGVVTNGWLSGSLVKGKYADHVHPRRVDDRLLPGLAEDQSKFGRLIARPIEREPPAGARDVSCRCGESTHPTRSSPSNGEMRRDRAAAAEGRSGRHRSREQVWRRRVIRRRRSGRSLLALGDRVLGRTDRRFDFAKRRGLGLERVRRGLGVVVLLAPPASISTVVGDDLGLPVAQAAVVVPRPRLEPALDGDLLALAEIGRRRSRPAGPT